MNFAIVAAVSAAAALSVIITGQAIVGPYRSAKTSSQVNGVKLFPASAFGDTLHVGAWPYPPHILAATRHPAWVSRPNCAGFENSANIPGFGNTAGATNEFANADPLMTDLISRVQALYSRRLRAYEAAKLPGPGR